MFFLRLIIICIIIFILFVVLMYTIKIKIVFKSFVFNLPKSKSKTVDEDSEVRLRLYVLQKIKVMDIDLKKVNVKKDKVNEQIDKLKNKFLEKDNNINLKFIKHLKELDIGLENVDFKIYLGLEDAAITGISVGIIASILGILLNGQNYKDVKYKINPIYENRNILNINFQGIIGLDFRNIINILSNFKKKRRVKENGRTSNRRAYVYGNE